MTVEERGRAAASALLESTRRELEAFAMLKEVKSTRSRSMSMPGRDVAAVLGAVAVIVALVVGWVLFRSAPTTHATTPQPSSTDSAAPTGTPVVSALHRYSVVPPTEWTFKAGSKAWTYGTDAGAPGVRDVFRSPTSPATIFVSSQPLPQGKTQEQWLTTFLPGPGVSRPACFPASATAWDQHRVLVDGHPGGTWGGDYGCSFTEVVVFAGNRVYDVSAQPDPSKVNTDIFDQSVLTAFLASMRLTP